METLAIVYIIMGISILIIFGFKRSNHSSGKTPPKCMKSTFTPNLNIQALLNNSILKQVLES